MKSSENSIKFDLPETKQALAILSVDNIKVSNFGLDLLKQIEEGKISHQEAVSLIVEKAKRLKK